MQLHDHFSVSLNETNDVRLLLWLLLAVFVFLGYDLLVYFISTSFCCCIFSKLYFKFAMIANVNSLVVFWPPKSLVRTLPAFNTRWMALVIISLYECRLTWRNNFVLHNSIAVGLATFLPTASENVWRAPYIIAQKRENNKNNKRDCYGIAV